MVLLHRPRNYNSQSRTTCVEGKLKSELAENPSLATAKISTALGQVAKITHPDRNVASQSQISPWPADKERQTHVLIFVADLFENLGRQIAFAALADHDAFGTQ
jgi:hypothetical protein